MKEIFYRVLFSLAVILIILQACQHEPENVNPNPDPDPDPLVGECHPDTVYFQNDLLPLLTSSCARSGCHDATTQADGVLLTNYESVMETGDVRPGRPENSDLYEVLVEDDPDKRMPPPPNEPLAQEQIQKFFTWIMQGALNLECIDTECDTENVTFSDVVFPHLQNHGCVSCHSGSSPSGGVLLADYAAVKSIAESGRLMGAIRQLTGYSAMPPTGDPMADCPVAQIQSWIDENMPND